MQPIVVLNVVGLTRSLLEDAPRLRALAEDGFSAPLAPPLPAVTCTSQATMLTGLLPQDHGIVGNGWYFRDLSEVWFWRQSNRLVDAEKVWETARKEHPGLRCAKIFWWYNMYSSADLSVTLRPIYPADGRKIPALYSRPPELQAKLQERFGDFPMFEFWGPKSGIGSSQWIANASADLFERERPEMMLVYLPHLDYSFQKYGPSDPIVKRAVREIDKVAGGLIDTVRAAGAEVVVVSEYGLEDAAGAVHPNRVLRDAGYVAVRETLGWELLDAGASRAFAVSDHQIAHIYVQDPADVSRVKELFEKEEGVERVLDEEGKRAFGLDHPRSGELVLVGDPGFWFTYYYWLDDARAPDFARTVDIHRKPGYDPVEIFLDPDIPLVKGRVLYNLAKKKLGFRYLMDVIPLRPDLVKGTHGRLPRDPERGPVLLSSSRLGAADSMEMTEVKPFLLRLLRGAG